MKKKTFYVVKLVRGDYSGIYLKESEVFGGGRPEAKRFLTREAAETARLNNGNRFNDGLYLDAEVRTLTEVPRPLPIRKLLTLNPCRDGLKFAIKGLKRYGTPKKFWEALGESKHPRAGDFMSWFITEIIFYFDHNYIGLGSPQEILEVYPWSRIKPYWDKIEPG